MDILSLSLIARARYCLRPVDLRSQQALLAAIQRAGLVPGAPTYILSECVLVYMDVRVEGRMRGAPEVKRRTLASLAGR